MSLPKLPVTGLDNENQRRRLPETINKILDHQFDDFRAQTPAEKLEGLSPYNYAYPPGDVRRYGAKGDGVTDDTNAIQRMMNVAGRIQGVAHFAANPLYAVTVYKCGSISVPPYITVTADDGVIIEKTDSGGSGTHIFDCISVLGTGTALTVDAVRNASQVTVTSASGLSVGQVVKIRTDTYKFSTSGRNEETNVITSIASLVVTLRHRLSRDYAVSDSAELVPFTTASRGIKFKNVKCRIPSTADGGGFYFENSYDCSLSDCNVTGAKGQASYQLWRATDIVATRCDAQDGQDMSTPGYGYGVGMSESCLRCVWRDSKFSNVRECAIAQNGKHCGYENCEVVSPYDNGFNTHGDGNEDCYFTDCRTLYSRSKGFTVSYTNAADVRIRFTNCQSFYSGYIGFLILGNSSARNKDIWLVNCESRDFGNTTASSYGIYVEYSDRTRIYNALIHDANSNGSAGMYLLNSTDIRVDGGEIRQLTSTYGIRHNNVTGLEICNMKFGDHGAAECVHPQGTASTGVWIHHLYVDQDIIPTLNTGDILENIKYPTIREVNRGVSSVADGGTISHGLGQTPTGVTVTTATADRCIAANTFNSTTFKVNINVRSTGAADGTAQNVSWIAWK